MERILVSACLLGEPVRYDGGGLRLASDHLARWRDEGRIVAFCPEVTAGLPTPRPPAEIEPGKAGADVLAGQAKVREDTGGDVTEAFRRAARLAVAEAATHGCRFALLTDGSPSCGTTFLYDGTFTGTRRAGQGVVAAALRAAGVTVFAQQQIGDLARALPR